MKQIKMADLAIAAGQNPLLLTRRPRGKAVYPHLEAALQRTEEGELLLITFSEEQDCDPSFIDETLIKLGQNLINGNFGEKGIALVGLSEGIFYTLRSTLNICRDDAKKENQDFKVAFWVLQDVPQSQQIPPHQWELAGHVEQSLLDVLHLLERKRSLSAADLVKELGLEISSASMRLKRLHERHLLRRDYQTLPNGREFVYGFWS